MARSPPPPSSNSGSTGTNTPQEPIPSDTFRPWSRHTGKSEFVKNCSADQHHDINILTPSSTPSICAFRRGVRHLLSSRSIENCTACFASSRRTSHVMFTSELGYTLLSLRGLCFVAETSSCAYLRLLITCTSSALDPTPRTATISYCPSNLQMYSVIFVTTLVVSDTPRPPSPPFVSTRDPESTSLVTSFTKLHFSSAFNRSDTDRLCDHATRAFSCSSVNPSTPSVCTTLARPSFTTISARKNLSS
mmetsp:Transcript_37823/g.100510  ORF Transcript_37823/g.100510 Transcript_37823/m.100510 type:complete len:248 (-) Transcript_37823:227-970(-)